MKAFLSPLLWTGALWTAVLASAPEDVLTPFYQQQQIYHHTDPLTSDKAVLLLTDKLVSPPIAPNFASFSIEISNAMQYFGPHASPNLPFATLCNVLRNVSGGRGPSVRIGGGSADTSLWWEDNAPLPPQQHYAITRADIASYAAALPLFDGMAVIDTSMFLQDNTSWAEAHISNIASLWGFSRIEGIEIGNEIDAYHDSGTRPRSWSEADYENEFATHISALEAVGMPRRIIQGATYCCDNPAFVRTFPNYTARFAASLASISWHHYALENDTPGSPPATVWALLAENTTENISAFLAPLAATANEAGIPFRVGEGNTVNRGGKENVSDVFASALFALDVQMHAALVGVSQWNWHGGPGAKYAPISFAPEPAPPGPPDVRALFYGLWAFTVATRGGARIAAATLSTSNPLIKLWALQQSPNSWSVLAIHKDGNATSNALVTVTPPVGAVATRSGGTLSRLLAPSLFAHYGVTFVGQTFDNSIDGRPMGTPVTEKVPVADGGSLVFTLPPASAAILVFETSA